MYCPSCAMETSAGLNYCKACGANLALPTADSGPRQVSRTFIGLFLSILLFGMTGVGGLVGILTQLRFMAIPPGDLLPAIVIVMALGSSLVVAVTGIMTWLLWRVYVPAAPRPVSKPAMLVELVRPQIAAPPPAMSSVTEHTTRNFDVMKQPRGHEWSDR